MSSGVWSSSLRALHVWLHSACGALGTLHGKAKQRCRSMQLRRACRAPRICRHAAWHMPRDGSGTRSLCRTFGRHCRPCRHSNRTATPASCASGSTRRSSGSEPSHTAITASNLSPTLNHSATCSAASRTFALRSSHAGTAARWHAVRCLLHA